MSILSAETDMATIGSNKINTRRLPIPLMALVLALFFSFPANAFRYQDIEKGHDFTIIGLGVFRQNLSSTDGPDNLFEGADDLFEDSYDGLTEGYSNRTRVSVYGEGLIYKDYTFLLEGHYDEEGYDNGYDDPFFLFELHRNRHFMILGDHRYGTFQDTFFTALDERLRGLTLHTGVSRVGATMVAGALRGETTTDAIRGDGTSGPYRLEEAPVIEGSETVTIEIRDRANPNRVIQQRPQARGTDYRIYYDDGEITFTRPVDEQDFRGNPTFIVVTYQYDTPGDRFKRAAWGSRVTVDPTETVRMGVSYLADGPWEDKDSGNALDNRRQIYGTDLTVILAERYRMGIEVSRSEIPELEDPLESDATVINVDANPVNPLRFYGRYWRVERDFLTFGNLNLQSDNVVDEIDLLQPFMFRSANLEFDLDPNISISHGTNEESYGLSAAYDISPFHTVSTGFRQTKDNIPDDDEEPQRTTRDLFASYKRIHPEKTDWLLGVEGINNENDDDPKSLDTSTNRIIAATRHTVGEFRYVGPTDLQLAYQFEDFNDHLAENNDTQTHDILGRIEFYPIHDFIIYGEQAEQFIYEDFEDDYTYRTDTSMIGVFGLFNRYADVDISAKYAREIDLIEDRTLQTEQTYNIFWTTLPFYRLKARLRFEYRETDDKLTPQIQTRHIYGGEIFWDIFTSLLATVRYEYETDETEFSAQPDESVTLDDLTLRLDYKFRRSLSLYGAYRLETEEVKAPPLSTTAVDTITWLFGAKYQITDRWDVLGAYKYKMIEDAIEDKRQKLFSELGYQLFKYLKVSLGYEYIEYTDEDTGEDYNSHVGYVSLIGNI